MVLLVAAIGLPFLLAVVLVSADIRSDLSELKAAELFGRQGTVLVGWGELDRYNRDGRASMLGYMMDGSTPSADGAPVNTFVLMPEAGQWLHPAHRIPDEMAEVRTVRPIAFKYRQLVWVTGRLNRAINGNREESPAWSLTEAVAEFASDRDITRWFTPPSQ
jgi:hypothetical protein